MGEYYRLHPGLLLTVGVKQFAEEHKCWWLVDVVWSYQHLCRKDRMLSEIQFWRFVKPSAEATTGTVYCDRDQGDTAFKQEIEFTDFPLQSCRLWVEPAGNGEWVVLLPEEH